MQCTVKVVYSETMRFGYGTFIKVEIRRYEEQVTEDYDQVTNDVVVHSQVVDEDKPLMNIREALTGECYTDAQLQRKGIKQFDVLLDEYRERFNAAKPAKTDEIPF